MNESRRKRANQVAEIPRQEPVLTGDQLEEILFPDISKDKFTINGKHFRIRALPWRWERLYRKVSMPLSQAELKPFERGLKMFMQKEYEMREDLGLTESFVQSEIEADATLTDCIVVICMSQDAAVSEHAAKAIEIPVDKQMEREAYYRVLVENFEDYPEGGPRKYLREIIRAQNAKIQMVQTLGESLMARLGEIATLLGAQSEFDSLKRDLSLRARGFIKRVGSAAGIWDKSFLPSTANGSPTPQTEEPSKKLEGESAEASPKEQAPLAEAAVQ